MDMLASPPPTEADREGDGFIRGVVVAVVTNNKDPDDLGRIRVRFPWQNEPQQSYWARVCMPMAMNERGLYCLPEENDEVAVMCEMGDLTKPVVIGSLYSGRNKPPSNNSNKKNESRIFVSRAYSELHFFDGDKPSVEMKLKDGKQVLLDDNGIKVADAGGNVFQIESGSGKISITSSGDIAFTAGGSMSLEAASSISMQSSSTVTIKGSLVQIN